MKRESCGVMAPPNWCAPKPSSRMQYRLMRNNRPQHRFITAGLLAIALGGSPCFGDTVWLTNGDRISGEITDISDSTLKIKTSYAATVSLDTSAIQSFSTDSAHKLQIGLKKQTTQIQKNDQQGYVTIDGKSIAIHDLRLSPSTKHWKTTGLLETALDVDNDHDRKEHLHINGELHLESEKWRHELKGEVKRDKEHQRITEDTQEYEYILDYLFSDHWLLRTDSIYREEGATITDQYIYSGLGPGYRLWGDDEDKLDIIVSYDHFWLSSGPLDLTLEAISTTLDYNQYWFDKKLQLFSDIQISHIYHIGVDYIANTSSGLRYYLTDHIHLSFKYDYNKTKYTFGKVKDSSYVLGAGMSL